MVHLTVEKSRLGDGANFDLPLDPSGAIAGDPLLFQPVFQFEFIVCDAESLLLSFRRIERLNESRLPKEEAQASNLFQFRSQCLIGVDREIGRNEREFGTWEKFFPQKLP